MYHIIPVVDRKKRREEISTQEKIYNNDSFVATYHIRWCRSIHRWYIPHTQAVNAHTFPSRILLFQTQPCHILVHSKRLIIYTKHDERVDLLQENEAQIVKNVTGRLAVCMMLVLSLYYVPLLQQSPGKPLYANCSTCKHTPENKQHHTYSYRE